MSEPGDVIWSDGRAWMRTDWSEQSRWITESNALPGHRTALRSLKAHDDFRWLVRGGKRVVHADDCPPQSAYEAYTFQIARLTELLAQAEKDRDVYAADWGRLIAERDRARTELAAMADQRDVAENRYADALAGQLSRAALEERAAIVAWLREPQGESVTPWCELLADSIERGDHLGGDDE